MHIRLGMHVEKSSLKKLQAGIYRKAGAGGITILWTFQNTDYHNHRVV